MYFFFRYYSISPNHKTITYLNRQLIGPFCFRCPYISPYVPKEPKVIPGFGAQRSSLHGPTELVYIYIYRYIYIYMCVCVCSMEKWRSHILRSISYSYAVLCGLLFVYFVVLCCIAF